MQKKYVKEGLAAVSVALDDPDDKDVRKRLVKFLQNQNAAFTNLLLEEKPEFWQSKLHFEAVPCVYVFNREGQWIRFEGSIEYSEIEKKVVELLKKK
jgi:hypothetical protein